MKRPVEFAAVTTVMILWAIRPALAADFTVMATFPTYTINGQTNPPLTVTRGTSYTFDINAVGHPFWIKTLRSIGTGNAFNGGVTNNGIETGTLTWTVPSDAPETLFYDCEFHSSMSNSISVVDAAPATLTPAITSTPTSTPSTTASTTPTATVIPATFTPTITSTPTLTPSSTMTQTPTSTPSTTASTTPTATATPVPGLCVGDCDGTGTVTVDEIITLVNIALGNAQPSACPNGVPPDAQVDIALIIQAVNHALNACGGG